MNLPEEITNLLDHCRNYGYDLLLETGELFPFGALTDATGRTHHREEEIDPKHIPSNGQIMERLLEYFQTQLDQHAARGYAIAYEASVQLDENTHTDALAVDIRYQDNDELPMFYFPFSMEGEDLVRFGEAFAVKRETPQ
ncbi:MAG: hypothetical protein EOM83_03000 [Clostridia bacterium]|nr:hypothetical protein [Clostridia bacterium]